jgi:trans-aconitate methyltransferase
MIVLFISLIAVSLLFMVSCVIAYDKIIVGKVPFISLPQPTLSEIISHLRISPSDVFYDLGCGDGRVLLAAAKNQPAARYVGVEKALWPYMLAKYKTRKHKNIRIIRGDIARVDISEATIIFIYLLPALVRKVASKFGEREIIAVEYPISNKQPKRRISLKNKTTLIKELFVY